jgi:hypothetical protein
LPVFRTKEHHGKIPDLPGLNQGQGFEQLVQRAKASRKNDEAQAVLHEHHLANEKVLKL